MRGPISAVHWNSSASSAKSALLAGEAWVLAPTVGRGTDGSTLPADWREGRAFGRVSRRCAIAGILRGARSLSSIAYRKDIDGLRAIAVLPVVFYHARLGIAPGGFVGVDIFFVISGYLIGSILLKEIDDGTFTLLGFYERRVRRIVPALTIVLVASTLAAFLILMPEELKTFGKGLAATVVFGSNIHFYGISDYFAPQSNELPLLHTWSLAVEEQFYIAFPLLLLVLARRHRARIGPVLAGLSVIALVAAVLVLARDQNAAFYLAPFRAWELLVGALLAKGLVAAPSSRLARELLTWLGLSLIAASVARYSSSTPFPGLSAVAPVLGAALVILGGTKADTTATRLLSLGPLVLIGLISYSLYLWHWPLISFAEYVLLRPLQPLEGAGVVAAAIALAAVTFSFVEQPFRRRQGGFTRRSVFRYGAVASATLAVAAGVAVQTDGLPGRIPAEARDVARWWIGGERTIVLCPRDGAPDGLEVQLFCRLGPQPASSAPRFLVWGDSHARVLISPFHAHARHYGINGWLSSEGGCPPILGASYLGNSRNKDCVALNQAMLALIETHHIKHVVLVARWGIYANGTGFGGESAPAGHVSPDGPGGNRAEFAGHMRATIETLLERGLTVAIVGPIPEVGFNVPSVMARAVTWNQPLPPPTSAAEFARRQAVVFDAFDKVKALPGVSLVYPHRAFCDQNGCRYQQDGAPLYSDDDHVNWRGAKELAATLEPIFPELAGVATSFAR